jgi:hypothetical protein
LLNRPSAGKLPFFSYPSSKRINEFVLNFSNLSTTGLLISRSSSKNPRRFITDCALKHLQ